MSSAIATAVDPASMNATRSSSKTAPPTKKRDGFHLVPSHPIVYDLDLSSTFRDVTYHVSTIDRAARIALDRPDVLHAFRPTTINEIRRALEYAQDDTRVSVIVLTSNLTSNRTPAFCAGGDQTVRSSDGGYDDGTESAARLRVLDLQVQMRRCPKPIIAVVRGYAIGGGHVLHVCADLTIAGRDAIFGQVGPRMGSVDAGYGSVHLARIVGQKRAREFWFLCRYYDAGEALDMGLINAVHDNDVLDGEVGRWVRRMAGMSPTALAVAKAAINADQDGSAGISLLGGHVTRLFYMTDEAREGRDAYLEGRSPDFRKIPQSKL
ncbi:hypothetical protein ACHAXA_008032 [Cyclostephanos tholiformis]|uniref:Naphthoate synthase n=1 Tax=Cyclostephanos tholiformis TaxID=382380 RepID=A0ABD3RFI2_9STRA